MSVPRDANPRPLPQPAHGSNPFHINVSRSGCWFLLARGSGIFVSAAKTLRYRSTEDADAAGLGHDEGRYPVDLCYAKVTARRGYDSLQVCALPAVGTDARTHARTHARTR